MAKPVAAEETVVKVPWRGLGGRGLIWAALIFAVLLINLAVRDGQFQAIHRLLMVVTAIGMIYFVVTRLVNVTELSVKDAQLLVRHGPLPIRGRVLAPIEHIDGLRCDAHGRRLMLRTTQGEDVILLEDVPKATLEKLQTSIAERLDLPLI